MSTAPLNLKINSTLLQQVDACALRAGVTRTAYVTSLLQAAVAGQVEVETVGERFFQLTHDEREAAIKTLEKLYGKCPEKGCWISWTTSTPVVRVGSQTYRAHRLSYMVYRQPIPQGWEVRAVWDVPGCISPEHLRLGTPDDMARDKVRKQGSAAELPRDPWALPWPPGSGIPQPNAFPMEASKKSSFPVNKYGERDVLVQLGMERKAFPAQFNSAAAEKER